MNSDEISIKNFLCLFNKGIEFWQKAGEMLVLLRKVNPSIFSDIIKACPGISIDGLFMLERIGRKIIYPYLLLDNSPGAKRLLTAPYEQQVKYSQEPVPVVTRTARGVMTVPRRVNQLNRLEVKQVFGESGVRSPSLQEEVLRRMTQRKVVPDPVPAKKLEKLATYKVLVVDGEVDIIPHDGDPPTTSQNVILQGDKILSAYITLCHWS